MGGGETEQVRANAALGCGQTEAKDGQKQGLEEREEGVARERRRDPRWP